MIAAQAPRGLGGFERLSFVLQFIVYNDTVPGIVADGRLHARSNRGSLHYFACIITAIGSGIALDRNVGILTNLIEADDSVTDILEGVARNNNVLQINSTVVTLKCNSIVACGIEGAIGNGNTVYVMSVNALIAVVKGAVTKDQINEAMKAAATESFGYNTDEIVSSDIIGSTFGSIFDATQTMVAPMEDGNTQVQVVSWYDNENSYTSQMVRTIKYFSELA